MIESLRWYDISRILWVNWLMLSIAYVLYMILWSIWWLNYPWLEWFLLVYELLSHLVLPLSFEKPPSWSTLQGSFHPIGWWLFIHMNCFFSWVLCYIMLIMSFPILLLSSMLILYLLVGFLRLWLFNYPLSFTLDFTTLNPMDWHYNMGVPSIVVSITYFQYFISIRWGSGKLLAFQCEYQIWSLMRERIKGLKMNSIVSN